MLLLTLPSSRRYDKDGSGQIDYKEFRQATRTDLRVPTKDMVLVGCFAQGGVVEGELMKGQRRKALLMKDAVEDSDLKRLFRMADKKGDGSISYEEFAAFMLKRNPKDTAKGVLQVRRSMHQDCLLKPRNFVVYPFFTHFPPFFAHFLRLDARNPENTARSPGENGKK